METSFVNSVVYHHMLQIDPKLAKTFKKKTEVPEIIPSDSPGLAEIVKHFIEKSGELSESLTLKADTDPRVASRSDSEGEDFTNTNESVSEKKCLPIERKRVIIRNIGKKILYENIKNQLAQFGEVTDFENSAKGFCLVTFHSHHSANPCIKALNDSKIAGKTVKVNIAWKRPDGDYIEGLELFVHGIKQEVGNDELKEAFDKFGTVTDAYNPGNGFAFVTYSSAEEASAAMEALDGKEVCGSSVTIKLNKPRAKSEVDSDKKGKAEKKKQLTETVRLFVYNISEKTSDEILKKVFSPYGNVTHTFNPGKGFAFVNFARKEEAEAAVEALNQQEVLGREITCSITEKKKKKEAVQGLASDSLSKNVESMSEDLDETVEETKKRKKKLKKKKRLMKRKTEKAGKGEPPKKKKRNDAEATSGSEITLTETKADKCDKKGKDSDADGDVSLEEAVMNDSGKKTKKKKKDKADD